VHMRAFQITVPEAVLEDLRERLVRTRRSPVVAKGWSGGTDAEYLASFVNSWASEFDWRDTESALNALPQIIVSVDGVGIHAFHIPASSADRVPVPLVLTHGWPSSFFEFVPLIGHLTDPAAYGGDPDDCFDLVIPSLPGFGFSGRLPAGECHPARIADLWVQVMDQLGYRRFGAYGGDIGSHVTNFLGAAHADRLIGVFTHHPNLHPLIDDDRPLSDAERLYLDQRQQANDDRDGTYSETQANRPDSLAPALSDSPAGLAAWILDKYREWSDCHGDLESAIDRQTLLNTATLYWVTNSIGTSFLPYVDDLKTPPLKVVSAPAGLALTPEDAGYPRTFAERTYSDVRMWRGPEPGGHFLALERPQRLVGDLREFFRPLRESKVGSRNHASAEEPST
ncbi:MAG: epoxide hydrolase family protein, partial [Acidimicrobiales bacterium]